MTQPAFVHLRMHSEYSVTDGTVRVDAAIQRAVEDRMPALALTDLGNLFGMVKFYSAARGAGVQPIIGAEVWVSEDGQAEATARVLLLAKNRDGYLRLCELLTSGFIEGQRRGRAEVSRQLFAAGDNSELIMLSGAGLGDVGQALLSGNLTLAEDRARAWGEMLSGAYYLEVQRAGHPQSEQLLAATVALAGRLDLPVVATHPIQFLDRDDFKAHEARVCISTGYALGDPRRPKVYTEEQYFKTQAEMAALFADLPEALENSVEIARRCSLSVELGKPRLPDFPTPEGVTLDDFMEMEATVGLERRLAHLYPDVAKRDHHRRRYLERLKFETDTIRHMGFSGYFLIVADFINWAKNNGVPVGPGRGSGAGSLVAYALGITDLDPLEYDLLFERFLNPERVSMPDFDIDFCQDGRDRVIDYVKRRYGAHAVSQIATFGTMAARAVIRDVGRVLDLGFNFVDQFAKLIPGEIGMTLAKAREQEPAINQRIEEEEEIRELWALAEKLEGLTRNVGMHAGGVLIAPGKLTDFCPLYCAQGSESVVSQFDKDDVEKIGLVKFDFLGLRTLTIIDEAVEFVRQLDPKRAEFRIEDLVLDDPAVYKIFAAGNTTAVFQSESRSAKDLERRLAGDVFEDIIALMALNRPGPLQSGMVDDFIARKKRVRETGKADPAWYFHPKLESVLKSTYGVIVYQEQVMLVAQILAGYSLGGADMLRRAMGKKKPEEMAKQRAIFTGGAMEQNVDALLAEHLFDLMEKFAEYGFNKSHSAAYALVAYQTGWLKHYYPAAFMAATMSSEMADTDKVRIFWEDAKENGIAFLPPDVNLSGVRFQPMDMRTIRYGLGAIKGTGEAALGAILRVREEGGPYKDLFDFCRRIDRRLVNRRVIEALIRAGAFDALDGNRAGLLASVGIAMEAGEQAQASANQGGLFDMFGSGGAADEASSITLIATPPWDERRKLLEEKQALGFFFSGHPFNAYRPQIATFVRTSLGELTPSRDPVTLAGIVVSMRTQMTRRGKMAFVVMDDGSATLEVSVFNELWDAQRGKIREDDLLVVEGKVSKDDFSGGLRVVAESLLTLGEARSRFARALRLSMNGAQEQAGAASAARLRDILAPFKDGTCPVRVRYRNHSAECELPLGIGWRVTLEEDLIARLGEWLKGDNVEVLY